ncbi:MAG TPA: TlpA family protein disulfide reductase [Caldithrix abyssi]|uniref:TlpA family protein disulfide reductase n=1 Tax=Caldithrix abyssi TaxID=187145 RepID=A0A7V1LN73_CALAY|nr:TlpA family protein disulfide reductase [Caldithrix abyssi]
MIRMKTLIFLILAFFSFQACSNPASNTATRGEIKAAAAPDFTIETLDHGTFKLSGQAGKVVYLFFIGYSCPPCIASSPNVEKQIQKGYSDDDVVVIGIDVWDGTIGQLSNFKIQTGATFPLGLTGSGVGGLYGAPNDYSVLIDQKGRKVYEKAGADVAAIKQKIDELLKE